MGCWCGRVWGLCVCECRKILSIKWNNTYHFHECVHLKMIIKLLCCFLVRDQFKLHFWGSIFFKKMLVNSRIFLFIYWEMPTQVHYMWEIIWKFSAFFSSFCCSRSQFVIQNLSRRGKTSYWDLCSWRFQRNSWRFWFQKTMDVI